MNKLEKQIAQLQKQRSQLDDRLKKLLQERNKTILNVFDHLPLSSLETATLIGGLKEVCERASQDKNQAEVWRKAGLKFCKSRQPAKATLAHNAAQKAA